MISNTPCTVVRWLDFFLWVIYPQLKEESASGGTFPISPSCQGHPESSYAFLPFCVPEEEDGACGLQNGRWLAWVSASSGFFIEHPLSFNNKTPS